MRYKLILQSDYDTIILGVVGEALGRALSLAAEGAHVVDVTGSLSDDAPQRELDYLESVINQDAEAASNPSLMADPHVVQTHHAKLQMSFLRQFPSSVKVAEVTTTKSGAAILIDQLRDAVQLLHLDADDLAEAYVQINRLRRHLVAHGYEPVDEGGHAPPVHAPPLPSE